MIIIISWKDYKTLSVLIAKNRKVHKYGNKDIVTIFNKIKFIDRARFIASSLSNALSNLVEGIHKTKWKDCDFFLEYESVKDDLTRY